MLWADCPGGNPKGHMPYVVLPRTARWGGRALHFTVVDKDVRESPDLTRDNPPRSDAVGTADCLESAKSQG